MLHILRQMRLQHLLQQLRRRHLPLVKADQRLSVPHRHAVRIAACPFGGSNLSALHAQLHAPLKRTIHPGRLPIRHPRPQIRSLGTHIRSFINTQPGGLGQLPGCLHCLGAAHILKHIPPGTLQLADGFIHGKRLLGLQHPQANPIVKKSLHPRRGIPLTKLQNIVGNLPLRIPHRRGKPPMPIPQILHAGKVEKLHLRLVSLLPGQPRVILLHGRKTLAHTLQLGRPVGHAQRGLENLPVLLHGIHNIGNPLRLGAVHTQPHNLRSAHPGNLRLPRKRRNLGSSRHGAERHHLQRKHGIGGSLQLPLPILNRHPVPAPEQPGKPGIQRSLERWLNHLLQPLGAARGQGSDAVAQCGIPVQPAPHHIRSPPHIPRKPVGKRHLPAKQPQRLKQALAAQPLPQHLRPPGGKPSECRLNLPDPLSSQLLGAVIAQSRKRADPLRTQENSCLSRHLPQTVSEPSPPGSSVRRLGHGLLDRPDLADHLRLLVGSPVGIPARKIQIRRRIHGGIHSGWQPGGPPRALAQVPGKIPGTLHHVCKCAGKRRQHRRSSIALPVYSGQKGTDHKIKSILIVSLQLNKLLTQLIGSIIENHLVRLPLPFFAGQSVRMNVGVATAPCTPALRFHLLHLLVGNRQLNTVLRRPLAGILHIPVKPGTIPAIGKEKHLGGSIQLRHLVQHLEHGIPLPQLLCYHGKLLFHSTGGTNGVVFLVHCRLVRCLEMPPNLGAGHNPLTP